MKRTIFTVAVGVLIVMGCEGQQQSQPATPSQAERPVSHVGGVCDADGNCASDSQLDTNNYRNLSNEGFQNQPSVQSRGGGFASAPRMQEIVAPQGADYTPPQKPRSKGLLRGLKESVSKNFGFPEGETWPELRNRFITPSCQRKEHYGGGFTYHGRCQDYVDGQLRKWRDEMVLAHRGKHPQRKTITDVDRDFKNAAKQHIQNLRCDAQSDKDFWENGINAGCGVGSQQGGFNEK